LTGHLAGHRRLVQEARPAPDDQEPGHVRHLVGAVLTTVGIFTAPAAIAGFILQLAIWLWFTVLFANFAEAVAEGRGKAQADSLRKARKDTMARRLKNGARKKFAAPTSKGRPRRLRGERRDSRRRRSHRRHRQRRRSRHHRRIRARHPRERRRPQRRHRRHARHQRPHRHPHHLGKGNTFLDRMIAMVEGAKRQKTPNEIALTILLSALTLIFLLVVVTLKPFGIYSGVVFSVPVLIALLVCLIPTTIGGLLSAIGISGIDRLIRRNVMATSGRAVEAAGDIDVLLLDKTGTITSATAWPATFVPRPASPSASPTPRNSPRSPTKRPKAAASSCSPRKSSACAAAKSPRRTPPSFRSPRRPA
jgi:K+-transporting ATPase ATPase B chain